MTFIVSYLLTKYVGSLYRAEWQQATVSLGELRFLGYVKVVLGVTRYELRLKFPFNVPPVRRFHVCIDSNTGHESLFKGFGKGLGLYYTTGRKGRASTSS